MDTRMRVTPPSTSNIPVQITPASESPAASPSDEPAGVIENSSETVQPTPAVSGDPGKSESDIELMVLNVAAAAEKFRSTYSETNEFVSKNGYLYDFPAQSYVSTKDLTDVESFNASNVDEDVMILYVKASDMPVDLSDGSNPDQMTVFAAFPYGDHYIASNGTKTSAVAADIIKGIQTGYNTDHGQIAYVPGNSATFAGVLALLGGSPGLSSPLDVRYMAEDDKYVSAVVSPHSDPTVIKEFVLQKTDNGCKIAVDKIETQWQKFVSINTAAPDVNLDLVPAYNLWRDSKDLKTDFSALLQSMASSGIISQDDGDPVFISGDNEFVFMEFANGTRMLAHNDDGQNDWKVYQVLQYEDALLRMQELSKFNPPPYFLIKQDG